MPKPSDNPTSSQKLIFGLEDTPPFWVSAFAGFQHLLAVIGGILTAPLIIALGMNLPVQETNYLLTSALLISGIATLIQVSKIGVFGSGLLSVQGTSFTFIGPILFAFYSLPDSLSNDEKLAVIFGSCAAASIVMMGLSYHIQKIQRIFTPTVTGTTVTLLGLTLVWATLKNIYTEFSQESSGTWLVLLMSGLVFLVTLAMSLSKNPWVRLSSIMTGLVVGFLVALFFEQTDFTVLNELDTTFVPIPLRFGLSFDWSVFLILLPIFMVSATESVGDLTATSALSRLSTSGQAYWQRVRGGVVGDALNSLIAGLFATFPNTTFSQNNGVIRLTGIASRCIGYIVASLLIVLGVFPLIGGLFQTIPSSVIMGSTLLMFSLVGLAGLGILKDQKNNRRTKSIALVSIAGGLTVSYLVGFIEILPAQLSMILQFPVSTGAFLAMTLELILPHYKDYERL